MALRLVAGLVCVMEPSGAMTCRVVTELVTVCGVVKTKVHESNWAGAGSTVNKNVDELKLVVKEKSSSKLKKALV